MRELSTSTELLRFTTLRQNVTDDFDLSLSIIFLEADYADYNGNQITIFGRQHIYMTQENARRKKIILSSHIIILSYVLLIVILHNHDNTNKLELIYSWRYISRADTAIIKWPRQKLEKRIINKASVIASHLYLLFQCMWN